MKQILRFLLLCSNCCILWYLIHLVWSCPFLMLKRITITLDWKQERWRYHHLNNSWNNSDNFNHKFRNQDWIKNKKKWILFLDFFIKISYLTQFIRLFKFRQNLSFIISKYLGYLYYLKKKNIHVLDKNFSEKLSFRWQTWGWYHVSCC